MSIARRRGLLALLLMALAVVAAGCMPSGAQANPGWTVLSAGSDAVYVALPTGKLAALDAANGQETWIYPILAAKQGGFSLLPKASDPTAPKALDGVYGLPALTDNLVLFTSFDHKLYAFDRTSGRKAWDRGEFAAGGAIIGGVTVYGGAAYLGSSDHRVYAVNANTGEAVWKAPFETQNWVWGAPAVDEKRVYVGSMDHFVYALNRETGVQEWKRDLGGSIPGAVTLSQGLIFAGGVDKKLHALKAENGQELWVRDLGHWVWGEALVQDGYVYIGTLDGKVHALSVTDGSPRWEAAKLEGSVRAGPVLLDGSLVMCTDSGAVYRVNLGTGTSEVLFKAAGAVLSRPAVVDKMLYVGTTLGNVYALDTTRKADPQVWVYPPQTKK